MAQNTLVDCPHCSPLLQHFEIKLDCILCDGVGKAREDIASAYVLVAGDRQFCDPQEILEIRKSLGTFEDSKYGKGKQKT